MFVGCLFRCIYWYNKASTWPFNSTPTHSILFISIKPHQAGILESVSWHAANNLMFAKNTPITTNATEERWGRLTNVCTLMFWAVSIALFLNKVKPKQTTKLVLAADVLNTASCCVACNSCEISFQNGRNTLLSLQAKQSQTQLISYLFLWSCKSE